MRKKLSLQRKGKFPIIYLAVGVLILSGCAGVSTSQVATGDSAVPVIESLKVSPSPEQTVVEITNSRPARYTAFRLVDPPRIILDIRGTLGSKLPATTRVDHVRENMAAATGIIPDEALRRRMAAYVQQL